MKRQIAGLSQSLPGGKIPDGLYLVRVDRARHCSSKQKPFFNIQFVILGPAQFRGGSFSARLDCRARALWKLTWFLRDFGYDLDLLGRDELDEKCVVGLQGAIKVSNTMANRNFALSLDAFAPASYWDQLRVSPAVQTGADPEVAR